MTKTVMLNQFNKLLYFNLAYDFFELASRFEISLIAGKIKTIAA